MSLWKLFVKAVRTCWFNVAMSPLTVYGDCNNIVPCCSFAGSSVYLRYRWGITLHCLELEKVRRGLRRGNATPTLLLGIDGINRVWRSWRLGIGVVFVLRFSFCTYLYVTSSDKEFGNGKVPPFINLLISTWRHPTLYEFTNSCITCSWCILLVGRRCLYLSR